MLALGGCSTISHMPSSVFNLWRGRIHLSSFRSWTLEFMSSLGLLWEEEASTYPGSSRTSLRRCSPACDLPSLPLILMCWSWSEDSWNLSTCLPTRCTPGMPLAGWVLQASRSGPSLVFLPFWLCDDAEQARVRREDELFVPHGCTLPWAQVAALCPAWRRLAVSSLRESSSPFLGLCLCRGLHSSPTGSLFLFVGHKLLQPPSASPAMAASQVSPRTWIPRRVSRSIRRLAPGGIRS